MLLINCAEFVFVGVGVITMDREDLGNKASARAAVEVHYHVKGIADIALDGPIRKLNSALEDAARKPGKSLLSGRCVDGREAATLMAMRLFFVQQLIAAFLILSVLFACVAVVVLILFALDHAWQIVLACAEEHIKAVGRPARWGRVSVNHSAVPKTLTPILERRAALDK